MIAREMSREKREGEWQERVDWWSRAMAGKKFLERWGRKD